MTSPERALSAYVQGEADTASLLAALRPYALISENTDGLTRVDYPGPALSHVTFSRSDVLRVLDRVIDGTMPVNEMATWASMLTLLDCFDLSSDDNDSDQVWDALDHMAHPLISGLDDAHKLRGLRSDLS